MKMSACIPLAALCLLSPPFLLTEETSQASPTQEKKAPETIDINRATAEEFERLPGIGPELARRIVAFREKHGSFRRVEDLLAIKGIGHKKWRAIRPYLKVTDGEKKS